MSPSVSTVLAPGSALSPPDAAPTRVMVVDDEESIRVAIARFLRSRGYEVTAAGSGADALAALDLARCDLVLCDVRMPGITGMDLLPMALAKDPDIAILMLTAVNDASTATEALARGAYDYLVKPVDLADLQAAVERALHRRGLMKEQQRIERLVREEVAARTIELERERSALRTVMVGVAETLINAMEAKDIYLRGHSHRVAELAASIAAELQLDEDTVEHVRLAGRLHDIGRIGTRESVLNKPGPLTPEEVADVRHHVRTGVEILAPLQHLGRVIDFVGEHHEQFDGGGYPRGVKGENISLGGRILAAAESFDALTSHRAYRSPLNPGEAIELLGRESGSRLDPAVFQALRNCVLRRRSLTFIE
jgi:putative nucleotidyltransferase with HDIG domain